MDNKNYIMLDIGSQDITLYEGVDYVFYDKEDETIQITTEQLEDLLRWVIKHD